MICVGEGCFARDCGLCRRGSGLAFGRRGNFNSPLSACGCSPLSPKGKASGVDCGGGMTVMRRYRSCRKATVRQEIPPQKGKSSKCCVEIICIRKQVTPLIFRNLLLKIFRKIENALRPSFVAVRRHLSPQGEGLRHYRQKSLSATASPSGKPRGRFDDKTAFLRKRRSAVFTVGFLLDKKIYVCRRARFAVFRELAEAFDQFRFRVRKGGVDKTLQVWQLRFA